MRVTLIDWLIVETTETVGTLFNTPVVWTGKLLNIADGFVTRIVIMWLMQVYYFENPGWATGDTSDVRKSWAAEINKAYVSNRSDSTFTFLHYIFILLY